MAITFFTDIAVPGHDIGIIATIPGVGHDAQGPHTGVIAIYPAVAHHIVPTADQPCTVSRHDTSPETEDAHASTHPTNPPDEIHIGHTNTPVDHKANHITRKTPE